MQTRISLEVKKMEQSFKIQTAVCTNCGAVCLGGHDDDGQIFCAKCQTTFKPAEINEMTKQDFNDSIVEKAEEKFERSGWIAYAISNK